jgi:hypothetical protein
METDQALTNFNELQNQLATTLNPAFIRQKTKDLVGNMLLMFGVPFFLGRLEKHLGAETTAKIKELISDPENIVNNTKKFATELFQNKVLAPVKEQVLGEASKYIPELKNLDLENASLSDLTNAFRSSVFTKLKQNLPAEIADKLPENFTRDDILNSLKDIGSDQALAFAKKNLPDEAYQQLVANKDLIRDPAKIGDFMRSRLSEVEDGFQTGIAKAKSLAQSQLKEVSQQLSGKFDEQVKPFKDAITSLQQKKQALSETYQNTINDINTRYESARDALKTYRSQNPGASGGSDVDELTNTIKSIQQEARNARTAFQNSDSDLADQITQAQSTLESKSQQILDTLSNVKSRAQAQGEKLISDTKQQLSDAVDSAKQRATQLTTDTQELAATATEEGTGFLGRLQSGASSFIGGMRQKASRFINPTRAEPDLAEAGHGYSMVEADQLTTGYTQEALSKPLLGKSKLLTDYLATSQQDPDLLLTSTPAKVIQPKSIPKPKKLKNLEPEFTDQEEAQKVLKSGGRMKPVEVLPKKPSAPPKARQPVEAAQPSEEQITREEQLATQQAQPKPVAEPTASGIPSQTTEPISKVATVSEPVAETESATADTGEQLAKSVAEKSTGEAVATGLDTAAAATEEVPVLDVIMDVAGLAASIFGGGSLMRDKEPALPIATGSSFEPGL